MNPVTMPPSNGAHGAMSSRDTANQSGRIQLSEYGDEVHKLNRREEMLLAKRLQHIERLRAGSSAAMRKSFQETEKLVESLQANAGNTRHPSLAQYDEWRMLTRYTYGCYSSGDDARNGTGVRHRKATTDSTAVHSAASGQKRLTVDRKMSSQVDSENFSDEKIVNKTPLPTIGEFNKSTASRGSAAMIDNDTNPRHSVTTRPSSNPILTLANNRIDMKSSGYVQRHISVA